MLAAVRVDPNVRYAIAQKAAVDAAIDDIVIVTRAFSSHQSRRCQNQKCTSY
jgi:hypothetical protein